MGQYQFSLTADKYSSSLKIMRVNTNRIFDGSDYCQRETIVETTVRLQTRIANDMNGLSPGWAHGGPIVRTTGGRDCFQVNTRRGFYPDNINRDSFRTREMD